METKPDFNRFKKLAEVEKKGKKETKRDDQLIAVKKRKNKEEKKDDGCAPCKAKEKEKAIRKRKREYQASKSKKFYATYIGDQKVISLSGIGRIFTGKKFMVEKKIFDSLKHDKNFKVSIG